jgi:hypothetical protein
MEFRDRGSRQRQVPAAATNTSVGIRGGGRSKGDPYMIPSGSFIEMRA